VCVCVCVSAAYRLRIHVGNMRGIHRHNNVSQDERTGRECSRPRRHIVQFVVSSFVHLPRVRESGGHEHMHERVAVGCWYHGHEFRERLPPRAHVGLAGDGEVCLGSTRPGTLRIQ
jgi:hypothetical protein